MPEEEVDDFDIVRDEDDGGLSRSTWLWIGAIVLVALFAFGVGAAFMILNNRIGDTPAASASAAPPTASPAAEIAASASPTATLTMTATPTITATATITATVTPEQECLFEPASAFMARYEVAQFGCAEADATIVWAAWQPFQHGSMLWRSDTDQAYVFYSGGQWAPVTERWDGSSPADRGAPPPGLYAPDRGFGYVWSRSDELFNSLGWALDVEKGFCALVQRFDSGFMLQSESVPSCTAEGLYNHATANDWQFLRLYAPAAAQRQGTFVPATPAAASAATVGEQTPRPPGNGFVTAVRMDSIRLDAEFDEWPGAWTPINAVVQGISHYDEPSDLSADFQIGWNSAALLFAVRVVDDVYRPGPGGTNQWRGDGLEIHFDRRLADDFSRTQADADDYQIGVAFDRDLTQLRGYRWLPFARETALPITGAVRAVADGYHVEFIIPWDVFEEDRLDTLTSVFYGFNLSVNDNDGNRPEQQTVLSFSPARTSHDNPTEWATLRLLP